MYAAPHMYESMLNSESTYTYPQAPAKMRIWGEQQASADAPQSIAPASCATGRLLGEVRARRLFVDPIGAHQRRPGF